MHGLGFFLGLTALNYAEVERESISLSQWSEMLFTMGVQCQFSCACVASLLAVSITYKQTSIPEYVLYSDITSFVLVTWVDYCLL